MSRPRLLDLFCGEGGAAVGYHQAGFDVEGVDMSEDVGRYYPFTFHLGDAFTFLAEHYQRFDAIHASPPCQGYSYATLGDRDRAVKYQRMIPAVRALLMATGKPYVIENVDGAFLEMRTPITLCGSMFGITTTDADGTPLELRRHRLFESNVTLRENGPCRHGQFGDRVAGAYGGGRSDRGRAVGDRRGGYTPAVAVQRRLLECPWMSYKGIKQAIPPAYTRHVGTQLLAACRAE